MESIAVALITGVVALVMVVLKYATSSAWVSSVFFISFISF